MFEELEKINTRPKPFEFYTASDLWTDEHTSKQMLSFHLNEEIDLSSRNAAFIDRSVEWIASHFNVGAGTKIADFGCGPGLYTTRLAKKQADVTGIDFSKRSIQYAQEVATREGLSIHYVNQNYLEFETDDRFHLILMIMCDFCALSPAQRKKMLTKFHTFLEPGGSVLLDVYSLNAFEQREETAMYEANLLNGFWSPNKYYGFLNTSSTRKKRWFLTNIRLSKLIAHEPSITGCSISAPKRWRGSLRSVGLRWKSSIQMLQAHHSTRKQRICGCRQEDIERVRAQDRLLKPSTRSFLKEARGQKDFSLSDWLHGYVYARWPYLYIGVGTGEHRLTWLFETIWNVFCKIDHAPVDRKSRFRTASPLLTPIMAKSFPWIRRSGWSR